MDTPNNGEIFLAESQGWKEEAKAVIYDVKDQVKDIKISDKLQVFKKSFFEILEIYYCTFRAICI